MIIDRRQSKAFAVAAELHRIRAAERCTVKVRAELVVARLGEAKRSASRQTRECTNVLHGQRGEVLVEHLATNKLNVAHGVSVFNRQASNAKRQRHWIAIGVTEHASPNVAGVHLAVIRR